MKVFLITSRSSGFNFNPGSSRNLNPTSTKSLGSIVPFLMRYLMREINKNKGILSMRLKAKGFGCMSH